MLGKYFFTLPNLLYSILILNQSFPPNLLFPSNTSWILLWSKQDNPKTNPPHEKSSFLHQHNNFTSTMKIYNIPSMRFSRVKHSTGYLPVKNSLNGEEYTKSVKAVKKRNSRKTIDNYMNLKKKGRKVCWKIFLPTMEQ